MSDEPLAFLEYFRGDDDPVMDDEPNDDFFSRVFESQVLKAAGIDADAFAAEASQRERTVARHYKKIAAGEAPAEKLAKRTRPVARVEKTGSTTSEYDRNNVLVRQTEHSDYVPDVISEFDERGVCVKTYHQEL